MFADGEPIKLPESLESLPKSDHFPSQRHRWNTNEVGVGTNRYQTPMAASGEWSQGNCICYLHICGAAGSSLQKVTGGKDLQNLEGNPPTFIISATVFSHFLSIFAPFLVNFCPFFAAFVPSVKYLGTSLPSLP